MSLQHLPLPQIKEDDLQRLLKESVRESRVIDYKRDWKLNTDQDRREFLADVASFANAGGGDLVYGVTEQDGVPQALVGLVGFAQDEEQLRVEHLLARWISPRLAGVTFGAVPLGSEKVVFIVRVTRSWSAPHMVTFNDYNRFFSRHSSGKYQMDVNELRTAFLQSAGAANRIRDFRLERVNRIAAGDVGVKLWGDTCVVLHIIPLTETPGLDPRKIIDSSVPLRPMGHTSGYSHQMTFDGLMVYTTLADGSIQTYVQLFRGGAIEAVMPDPTMQKRKRINPAYEGSVRRSLQSYLTVYSKLGITPPYFVALSLVNVGGFTIHVRDDGLPRLRPASVIDRPHLLLPETAVDAEPNSVDPLLKPIFDLVWNAGGYFGSPNFDEQGKWREGVPEL